MAGERVDDGQRGGILRIGEDVAHDSLVAFVDAEGEPADAPAGQRDEAGQDARVEILQQQLCRGGVVPAQAPLPESRLLLQQRTKLARGEVAQIEHFELLGRGQG